MAKNAQKIAKLIHLEFFWLKVISVGCLRMIMLPVKMVDEQWRYLIRCSSRVEDSGVKELQTSY